MNPYLLEDMRTIEKIQRRATKLIPSIKQCTYQERLSALNLPSSGWISSWRIKSYMVQYTSDRIIFYYEY